MVFNPGTFIYKVKSRDTQEDSMGRQADVVVVVSLQTGIANQHQEVKGKYILRASRVSNSKKTLIFNS